MVRKRRKNKAAKASGGDSESKKEEGQRRSESTVAPSSGPRFSTLEPALRPETLAVVESLGFSSMTPVQASTIPLFMTNKDVAVEACTGSGKTLAFVIPVIEMLQRPDVKLLPGHVGCIILSPTRELARQIYHVMSLFTAAVPGLRALLLTGGSDVQEDLTACAESCSIIVGTPGRIFDVLKRGDGPSTKHLEVLVLDEADTLLDFGFADAINMILNKLPKQRRTGLFSATQTKEVKALARAGLRNPVIVSVKVQQQSTQLVQRTPTTLDNQFVVCPSDQKLSQLVHFLGHEGKGKKVIVFFMTCACVDFMHLVLPLVGVDCAWALHGRMPQNKRVKIHKAFTEAPSGVLLCTDVAARGIDIPDIDWIIQFHPPQDPNFFVHRVGRTARAGRSGQALVYLLPSEDTYIHFLSLHKVPICSRPVTEGVRDVLPVIKQAATTSREVLEKGTQAFISFMRGYKEHKCRFIFRFSQLDVGAVARAFALLKLPKLTEFRTTKVDFEASDVNTALIPYSDAKREARRQAKWEQEKKEAAEKLFNKKERLKRLASLAEKEPQKRKRKHKGTNKIVMEQWDALANEERLARRLRQGKITREEFDEQLEAAEDREMALAARHDDSEMGAAKAVHKKRQKGKARGKKEGKFSRPTKRPRKS